MREKHIFSERYTERKQAVLNSLGREGSVEKSTRVHPSIPIRIFAAVALLSALSVGVFAATKFIDFSLERDGDNVYIHAGLNGTDKGTATDDKPLRSWNIEDGGVGIKLNIPDLPSDLETNKTAAGKYGNEDSSRAITVNGVDLRRSDLEHIIVGATDTRQLVAGNKPVYIVNKGEDSRYDRIAYIVFEEDELVLKLWVSRGITDDELMGLAATLEIEYTTDSTQSIPILNELGDGAAIDLPATIVGKGEPVYEKDLAQMGEPVHATNGEYTVCIDSVSVYDDVNALDPDCIIRGDIVDRFSDENGNLIEYNRTQIVWLESAGKEPEKAYREGFVTEKKLYVLTLTMSDLNLDKYPEEDRDVMLRAFVNSFNLNSYTERSGEIDIFTMDAVVDQKAGESVCNHEIVYRECLGDGRWKIAYLLDSDIAEKELVLSCDVSRVYVKIK